MKIWKFVSYLIC